MIEGLGVTSYNDLLAAIKSFNAAERAELERDHGLRYLGGDGPAFLAGTVRMRGLFIDESEVYWTDATLVVESAYLGDPAWDYWAEQPSASMEPVRELWVFTPERGRHCAILAPLDVICFRLELPDLTPLPSENWVRHWRTYAEFTDASEIERVAHGMPR